MASLLAPLDKNTQWTAQFARHLLNRAGFFAPHKRVEELVELGFDKAVSALVDFDAIPDTFTEPDFFETDKVFELTKAIKHAKDEDQRREFAMELRELEKSAMRALQTWWLRRMDGTPRPLQEKLALFWHGHFATSNEKVKNPEANYRLNAIFRKHAAGDFKQLLTAVGQSHAMLVYLDNRSNVKGHPNENWARELMELFTLGIGNYTEQDIKEMARAFTGWTFFGREFIFNRRQHDAGNKTIFGKTGNFDGHAAIDLLFTQEALPKFIAKKLWEFFAYENPEPELVDELAGVFKAAKFHVRPVLDTLFRSQAFYSAKAVRTQIKSPVQLLLGMVEQLQLDFPEDERVHKALHAMGQELFAPPNVKGWPGNREWINTNTLLLRYNLGGIVMQGGPKMKKIADVDELFLPFSDTTLDEALDGLCERLLGATMDAQQRQTLLNAADAKESDAVADLLGNKQSQNKLRAIVHLILSSAEYQLC